MKETADLIVRESQMYIFYFDVVPGYKLSSPRP